MNHTFNRITRRAAWRWPSARLRRPGRRGAGAGVRAGRIGDRDQARPDDAYSGPASAYGTIGKVQAYFKMINDNGGINGRKINLISLDDGYSPPKAVEAGAPPGRTGRCWRCSRRSARQQLGDPQVRQRQEGAAPAAPRPARPSGAIEGLPVDDGLQPQLPVRARSTPSGCSRTSPPNRILYQNDDYSKDVLKGVKGGLGAAARDDRRGDISGLAAW
jgi:branched-chain amino acid transport system substrate-binding protein